MRVFILFVLSIVVFYSCKDINEERCIKGYYENGNIKFIHYYPNESQYDSALFYDINGKLISKNVYLNGKEAGSQVLFFTNGKVKQYFLIHESGKILLHQIFDTTGVIIKETGSWIPVIVEENDTIKTNDTAKFFIFTVSPPAFSIELFVKTGYQQDIEEHPWKPVSVKNGIIFLEEKCSKRGVFMVKYKAKISSNYQNKFLEGGSKKYIIVL